NLTDEDTLKQWSNDNLKLVNKLEDLIYVIYTSGTTGKPKGVKANQKNLSNLVMAYQKEYELTQEDIILQFASPSFDQSIWDIFCSTLLGACCCLVPKNVFGNPIELERYMNHHRVTVAALTPLFIKEMNPNNYPYLRVLESGAESPQLEILKSWNKNRDVFNTYGPTETTVNALSYKLKGNEKYSVP
ncbi:AMP-binding protein, partial [Staphylococcus capitis]